jgi:Flp pilus assembly protein CpaB
VYAGFNVVSVGANGVASGGGQGHAVVRRVLTDIPVVAIGGSSSGSFNSNSNANLSFKVTDQQAADLAFASQNGTLWLGLEPAAGLKTSRPTVVTMETLLLGVPPVAVLHSLGGRH